MPSRAEIIKQFVINASADDYETLELITIDVTRFAAEAGVPPPKRDEIKNALRDLISNGLTKAYRLSGQEPFSTEVEYTDDAADELWFYITPAGKKHLRS